MSDESDGASKDTGIQGVSRMDLSQAPDGCPGETPLTEASAAKESSSEGVSSSLSNRGTVEGGDLSPQAVRSSDASGEEETRSSFPNNGHSLTSSPVEKDSLSSTDAEEGDDDSKEKGRPGKRDRSKLRKGKWTVEEEEYTSRIIHYFNTGLLTLPEGATLRSYLADKLNCDPMRVTKKYAGASCLGRRVYHFHNRPQPTVAQIQLAKTELDLLEQRFRQRVEEGRSGLPAPSASPSLLMNLNFNLPSQPNPLGTVAALQSLLLNLAATAGASGLSPTPVPSAPVSSAPALPSPNLLVNNTSNPILDALGLQSQTLDSVVLNVALARAAASLGSPTPVQQLAALNQLLLQNQAVRSGLFASPSPAPSQSVVTFPSVVASTTPPVASLGPVLAAAPPVAAPVAAIPPPAATPSLPAPVPATTRPSPSPTAGLLAPVPIRSASAASVRTSYAEQLKRTYEEHLKSHNIPSNSMPSQATGATRVGPDANTASSMDEAAGGPAFGTQEDQKVSALPSPAAKQPTAKKVDKIPVAAKKLQPKKLKATTISKDKLVVPAPQSKKKAAKFKSSDHPAEESSRRKPDVTAPFGDGPKPRTDEDKAAGTILIGFLSSLRDSYEEALRARTGEQRPEPSVSDCTTDDARGSERNVPNVTDWSSSQQPESSVEDSDWNSDKKTDPSSSEDSDKDEKEANAAAGHEPPPPAVGKGPPRKRLKRIAMESNHHGHHHRE